MKLKKTGPHNRTIMLDFRNAIITGQRFHTLMISYKASLSNIASTTTAVKDDTKFDKTFEIETDREMFSNAVAVMHEKTETVECRLVTLT